jgi:sortase A
MKDKIKKLLVTVGEFFKAAWAGKLSRALLLLSGALLIAAGVTAVCLFDEGVVAASNAKTLMEAYEQAVLPEAEEPTAQADEQPLATTAPEPSPVTIDGYQVIGKLDIPKIEAELPVIAFTDDKALKVSVCYYQGPMPNETGNLVITGHNFASGAHFGRLKELSQGDEVIMSMPDGSVYRYAVYDKQEIKPDDVEALDEFEGDRVLTLMTCTSHGNRRLLVRCALQAN